jgi:hypothetical protein
MRKLIKNVLTLEPPFGEAWVVIIIVIILSILRVVELEESLAWVAAALAYISIFLTAYLIQKAFKFFWNNFKK